MSCDSRSLLVLAGICLGGILMGLLFRPSEAERRQQNITLASEAAEGYSSFGWRRVFSTIAFMILIFSVMIGAFTIPPYVLGGRAECRAPISPELPAFVAGVFVGWFLRFMMWRLLLWRKK
jgi:hypothetical protein